MQCQQLLYVNLTITESPRKFYAHCSLLRQLPFLSRAVGGTRPQKFEKRVLTIFCLEPDPYESVHQLDCSLLFPTAMANGTERYNNFLLSDPTNKQQTSEASDRQHGFRNTTETN